MVTLGLMENKTTEMVNWFTVPPCCSTNNPMSPVLYGDKNDDGVGIARLSHKIMSCDEDQDAPIENLVRDQFQPAGGATQNSENFLTWSRINLQGLQLSCLI